MTRMKNAVPLVGCLLLAAAPALAVNGGALDGGGHPAVGFIFGSLGTTPCDGQVLGCSGVLIDPNVFLTSAACADVFANPLEYGYDLQAVWVSFDPDDPFDCVNPSLVTEIIPNPAWDETSPDPIGNVGILRLSAPAAPAPAVLPAEGLLDTVPDAQPYTVVAFGDDDGGTGTSAATLARRTGAADFKRLSAEHLRLTLQRAPHGQPRPCIGALNEAGAAYLGSSDGIAALVVGPDGGSCATDVYQRLDIPSVRTFLAGYVTLP